MSAETQTLVIIRSTLTREGPGVWVINGDNVSVFAVAPTLGEVKEKFTAAVKSYFETLTEKGLLENYLKRHKSDVVEKGSEVAELFEI